MADQRVMPSKSEWLPLTWGNFAQRARGRRAFLIGAVILTLLYVFYYIADPAMPTGHVGASPGWWGWFDQSQYLNSATALWLRDLNPARHWYPLGYSLVAAPFTAIFPLHPFFVVDLVALLVSYSAFMALARFVTVPARWAAAVFALTTMADPRLGILWTQPWNTTLSAALIWTLLALIAAHLSDADAGTRAVPPTRWAAMGALVAALPLVRASDAVIAFICAAVVIVASMRARMLAWRGAVACIGGVAAVLIPYGALHLAIYGARTTDYMVRSAQLGFVIGQLPWKAAVLLLEPRPWFPDGTALLARCPWIAIGIAGLVPVLAAARGAVRLTLAMLAVVMLADAILYIAYVDLIPTGLWRYHNAHYFKWLLPGFGLYALMFVQGLNRHTWRIAAASAAFTGLLLSPRDMAAPVGSETPARMVQFPAAKADWAAAYFADTSITDDAGRLANIFGVRLIPDDQGVRVIGLTRLLHGVVHMTPDAPVPLTAEAAPQRWAERWQFGPPCWLPPYPCEQLPPITASESMAVAAVHRAIHRITAAQLSDAEERAIADSFVMRIGIWDALPFVFAKLDTRPPGLTPRQYRIVQAQIGNLPAELRDAADSAMNAAIARGQLKIAGPVTEPLH